MMAKAELGPLYGIVLPILIEVSVAPGSYCFSARLAQTDSTTITVANNAIFAFDITCLPSLIPHAVPNSMQAGRPVRRVIARLHLILRNPPATMSGARSWF